jgi:hypothetical protein
MNVERLKNAKNVPVKFKGEDMTAYQLARWLTLMESIEIISKSAERMNIDLSTYGKWVKPLAIQKYVDERTYGMIAEVLVNEKGDECIT